MSRQIAPKTIPRTSALLLAAVLLSASAATQAQAPYYDAERDLYVSPAVTVTSPLEAPATNVAPGNSRRFDWVLRDGLLAEGLQTLSVDHGSEVLLMVQSDLAEPLRIEGYDLRVDLVPGQTVLLSFLAERPGRYAIRVGRVGRQTGALEVGPPLP